MCSACTSTVPYLHDLHDCHVLEKSGVLCLQMPLRDRARCPATPASAGWQQRGRWMPAETCCRLPEKTWNGRGSEHWSPVAKPARCAAASCCVDLHSQPAVLHIAAAALSTEYLCTMRVSTGAVFTALWCDHDAVCKRGAASAKRCPCAGGLSF